MTSFPLSLKKYLARTRVKHILKGQILFYEGDRPAEVFLVKSGVVKVYDIDNDGNEKVLHLLSSSAVLPLSFFDNTTPETHWYYTALTDCEVWVVPRKALAEMVNENSKLAVYFMSWFFTEMHELLVRLDSMGKTNTQDKLVAALRFLAVRHSRLRPTGWYRVRFAVNHQLLANLIGMTRESTSMKMKELADSGAIRNPKNGVLEINLKKLP